MIISTPCDQKRPLKASPLIVSGGIVVESLSANGLPSPRACATQLPLLELGIICRGCRMNRVCRGVGCAC
jgi:hypothetical protein